MRAKTTTCYEEQVDQWVSEAVAKGARSLDEIICALPGVYPTVVAASVVRLQLQQFIEPVFGRCISAAIRDSRNTVSMFNDSYELPTPHPLDYDWRFTQSTANTITKVCRALGRRLLCLGTPSVFVRAKSGRHFVSTQLVDNNAEMVRHLESKFSGVIRHDISRGKISSIVPADVVALDPPWYLNDLQEFVWFASKMCVKGGHLVVCLPAEGTRPNVKEELRKLLKNAKDYGFSLLLDKPNALRYQTPHFERNALDAAGVDVKSDWRRGTLWILRKKHRHNLPQPSRQSMVTNVWSESTIFGTRFRFKKQARFGFVDPTLTSIIDGDVLQSVSRRNRMREFVDVWTSGNRVFACRGTDVLQQIASAIEFERDVYSFVQNQLQVSLSSGQLAIVERVTAQIRHIASLEAKERGMTIGLAKDRYDARTNS